MWLLLLVSVERVVNPEKSSNPRNRIETGIVGHGEYLSEKRLIPEFKTELGYYYSYHIEGEIGTESQVDDTKDDHGEDEGRTGNAETDDVTDDKVDVDSNHEDGQTDGEEFWDEPIGKLPHDPLIGSEGDGRNDSEWEHQGHEAVEQVVHPTQTLDVLIESNHEGGQDCDSPGEQNSHPFLPLEVEEALHGELAGICPRHGAGLTGS